MYMTAGLGALRQIRMGPHCFSWDHWGVLRLTHRGVERSTSVVVLKCLGRISWWNLSRSSPPMTVEKLRHSRKDRHEADSEPCRTVTLVVRLMCYCCAVLVPQHPCSPLCYPSIRVAPSAASAARTFW